MKKENVKNCGRHMFAVTSPIDTIETCIYCGVARECPILSEDERFMEGKEPPNDAK